VVPILDALALSAALASLGQIRVVTAAYALVAFVLLRFSGNHDARINPRLSDDLAGLLGRLAAPLLVMAPFVARSTDVARLLQIAPLLATLTVLGRAVGYKLINEARARGFVVEPTLIVGAGTLGVKVAQTIQEHAEFGLFPIGFLDSFDDNDLPLPILGDVHELEPIIREFGVRRVIVAFGGAREPEMVKIIRACDRLPVEVHVVPRFFELGVGPAEGPWVDDLWGIPLMRLRRAALRTMAWRTKRVFDVVVASAMLALAAPLMGVCALAVRLSGPGPMLFRQKRIGQRGEVFHLLKFRTMAENQDSDTTWNVSADGRRTPVGSLMRRLSLDELPQLLNVIRGEMSLVGPRPERPFFVDQFRVAVPGYDDRHRVPAGLTGWAQVHGLRGDTSIPERALFDNHYVEHWSLWRDVVIMFRTIGSVLSGDGS